MGRFAIVNPSIFEAEKQPLYQRPTSEDDSSSLLTLTTDGICIRRQPWTTNNKYNSVDMEEGLEVTTEMKVMPVAKKELPVHGGEENGFSSTTWERLQHREPSFIEIDGSCQNPLHHQEQEQDGPVGRHQHLKLIPFAILVFYNVSGGPFGIEASVRAGGNFFAILGFAILPLAWSVPEALVTAELGSAFPEASGGVAWVEEAFGEKAGLMCGYLNWVSGATDNAIYPALFLEYVTSLLSHISGYKKEETMPEWVRFFVVSAISVVLARVNYTGLEIVGTTSVVVCVLAMSPFIVMCIIGIPKVDPSKWLLMPDPDEDASQLFDDDSNLAPGPIPIMALAGVVWRPYLNNLFWNLNSFDAAASFAGEVRDISRSYPRGIFIGLGLVVAFYLFPLLVATGATESSQEDWKDGHMASVALEIGGPLLGGWIVFAAGISNLALFEAEMSADAFQLMGMAERGYLPKVFATRSVKYGTPTYGIAVGTLVIVAMSVADFSQLVEMLNFNYAISLLMEYSAFVTLRYTHGHVARPYRIPIPDCAAILLVLPPSIMIAVLFLASSWLNFVYVAVVLAVGAGLYHLQQTARARGWCEFTTCEYAHRTITEKMPVTNGSVDGGLSNVHEYAEDIQVYDSHSKVSSFREADEVVQHEGGTLT